MTTAKKTTTRKTTADKVATDNAADANAAQATDAITVDGDKLAAAVADTDRVDHPAPEEAEAGGKVAVICLREFNDLDEGIRRHVGDRFSVTPERAADIIAKFKPELIAVIGGGDE